jgi:hypothetical protein
MQPPVVEPIELPGTHELVRRHHPQPGSGAQAAQPIVPALQLGGAASPGVPPSPPHWLGR